MGSLADRLLHAGLRRLLGYAFNKLEAEAAIGVIDFEAHRCVHHSGRSHPELVVGDRRWRGATGRAVDGLSGDPASASQPLWLVDLVRGVVDAREQAAEGLHGRATRRLSAHADLNRAAEAVSYQMAVPAGIHQLGDLEHIALEVWIDDDDCIRRIRHTSGDPKTGETTCTLDLIEFGIELPSDWSRIPALLTDHQKAVGER